LGIAAETRGTQRRKGAEKKKKKTTTEAQKHRTGEE